MGRNKFAEEWGRGLGGGGSSTSNPASTITTLASDEVLIRTVNELLLVGRERLLLSKIGVAMVFCIAVMWDIFIIKK